MKKSTDILFVLFDLFLLDFFGFIFVSSQKLKENINLSS